MRVGKEKAEKHFTYNRKKKKSFWEPRGENLEEAKRGGRGSLIAVVFDSS